MTAATAIAQNRLGKALRLANTLAEAGANSFTLTQMRERDWVLASLAAHCSIPSNETRSIVSQLLAARETRRRTTV